MNNKPLQPSGTLQANGVSFSVLKAGVRDGAPVLLLHGFPDDPGSWRPLMDRLAAQGKRVVAPWLRGYGPTGGGDTISIPILARDVVDLAAQLGPGVQLVGHDWGAVAAYAAAALAPERFSGLVALSVPPPPVLLRNLRLGQLRRSWYMLLFQMPMAEHALRRNDFALIDHLWTAWSPGWRAPAGRIAEVKETFRAPGTARAAVAYYRSLLPRRRKRFAEAWRLANRVIPIPTRILVGTKDRCLPPALFRGSRSLTEVAGAGHFLPLEAPDAIDTALATLA